MMAAILNSAIMDSAILHKKELHKFILTQVDDGNHLELCHSETAILDSDTFIFSLRFTQKHSHSTLTLTQTNSIWLKLIHSHSTWWWQPSWIQPFCTKLWLKLVQSDSELIYSYSTWWWQPSWILPSWNLPSWISAILLFPLKLTHTCQDWIPPFAQKKLHWFILTPLDDGNHLEFCHLGFKHLVFFSEIHSKTLSLHSDSDSN